MPLMTLMLHLEPTTMGPGAVVKLNPGHSLLAWGEVLVSCTGTNIAMALPGYEACWTGPQPMAWFLSLQTCLMIAGPDPILDLLADILAWPWSVFHRYIAFWPELLVGPGHHLWVCPAYFSLALWDWDLAGKTSSWLLAHLSLRSSPGLAAIWEIYPGVWTSGAPEGAAALSAGARKQCNKSEREGELSSQK